MSLINNINRIIININRAVFRNCQLGAEKKNASYSKYKLNKSDINSVAAELLLFSIKLVYTLYIDDLDITILAVYLVVLDIGTGLLSPCYSLYLLRCIDPKVLIKVYLHYNSVVPNYKKKKNFDGHLYTTLGICRYYRIADAILINYYAAASKLNFNDDEYNFIYGIVDELSKNVLKVVSQRSLDEKEIQFISRCNINAIFRLFKLPYPRVDSEDLSAQSHIFLNSPPQSGKVVFTSTIPIKESRLVTFDIQTIIRIYLVNLTKGNVMIMVYLAIYFISLSIDYLEIWIYIRYAFYNLEEE
ncbi:hypothetical protein AGLY_004268 [Aphis glycines]|uniref:Uncharacterized protein n=1 Tax=Aphis glycines TaxID=307491 RepID=A0A6G0TZX7_APHGL|nr:hypothetical protein AGLY_004268 [Aphis glycines]